MFHHRKETLILAVPILFGRQINTGKFAEAVRSGIQVIRERPVSWMWGWLPTFYSTLLLICLFCLYLLRELLQLFLNAGLVHRKKGVIEKWHGPWCHLAVNAVSVQQFRSVEVAGSLGVFGPRVPTLQRRWGLDFCQLLDSQDLWLITCFQWFLGTRTYFLQNPKRRLIFSVLNESNSVEPEDLCSVRVDTDDECDAQFCTKFGCCHYSMLYTVTTQESLASLFLYENLLTFRPSDHPFCKFRPWLACQCKAAHCVEQCAYMWRQWPTSGPHQTCASVFLREKAEKATHVIFGQFKVNSRDCREVLRRFPRFPLDSPFFLPHRVEQDLELRTRLGHQTIGRDSARSWKVGVLSCHFCNCHFTSAALVCSFLLR